MSTREVLERSLDQRRRYHAGMLMKLSYSPPEEMAGMMRLRDYDYDWQLSTDQTRVLFDKINAEPVIVHRGSKTMEDFAVSDVALALNVTSPRLIAAKKVTAAVERKYGKTAVQYGHSLGGYLARRAGRGKVFTLDMGAGLGELFQKRSRANETDWRTSTDAVSALAGLSQRGDAIETIPFQRDPNKNLVLDSHDVGHLTKYLADEDPGFTPQPRIMMDLDRQVRAKMPRSFFGA